MKSPLQARKEYLSSCIKKLPGGKLIHSCTGKYVKWYQSGNNTKKYIPKSNIEKARQLALQNFYSELLALYEKLSDANDMIHTITNQINAVNQKYGSSPYAELLNNTFSDWENQPYVHSTSHPEHLKIKAAKGCIVRSKSEALIANALYSAHIPFRYECELKLGNHTIFPDFTIQDPNTHEIKYWEHLGLLDKSEYREETLRKLQLYISNGILPGIDLFLTCETSERPLDQRQIELIIQSLSM